MPEDPQHWDEQEAFDQGAELSADALIGRRVGNYIIERPLAQGGMGSVFVAKHPQLGREVAVKFLGTEVTSEGHTQRFLSEAQVTASLHHPNIVDIFDFGELDGRLYYVMELLRGRSLRAQMRAQGRFTPVEVNAYVTQMCSALAAAHSAGIVHRDLKPGNVFVVEGALLRVKLLDFGVAKLLSTGGPKTLHGQVLGTPTHMAPEQALGDIHRITHKSDLYSLGVIAYEMLTGLPVFRAESELMVMVMHIRDAVPPIRDLVPEVPEAVAAVIESCLAKDPKARPESAREVAEALSAAVQAAQGSAPVPAVPSPVRPPRETEPLVPFTPPVLSGTEPTMGDSLPLRPLPLPVVALPADQVIEAVPARPEGFSVAGTIAAAMVLPEVIAQGPLTMASQASEPQAPEPPVDVIFAPKPEPKAPLDPTPEATPLTQKSSDHEATPAEPAAVEATGEGAAKVLPLPSADTPLSAIAQATLNKLMLRLQRKGDFPAFAQAVGEVTKKADANGAYSAGQLGDSIRKDYALTAKLLRIVNSTYANRFGGKIYSIQHAIVLLGFDRVRSLALSIALFKGSGKSGQAQSISDSAVSSLVSGEIARSLAWDAKLNDEEAMVCAMFRDLGRHLVIVYLPEQYEQIVALRSQEGLSLRSACERALGTTFARLGVAIAQNWRLPPRIVTAISAIPNGGGALPRVEDRLSALSEFASDLCELVASEPAASCERAISALLAQHKNLLSADKDALIEILRLVQESMHQKYVKQLGLDVSASRFLTRVRELVHAGAADLAPPQPGAGLAESAAHGAAAPITEAAPVDSSVVSGPLVAPVRLVKAIALAGTATPPQSLEATTVVADLEQRIDAIASAVAARKPSDEILSRALKLCVEQLGVARILVLSASAAKDELIVRYGIRDDIDALGKELRFPLREPRTRTNLFASTYQSGKDIVIPDAFVERKATPIPVRYYEVLGSPAFAIYGCLGKGIPPALLLVDVESADDLPAPGRVAPLAKLRPLIAQAAASRL